MATSINDYLVEGQAEIAAYTADGEVVQAWPAMDMLWDANRQVFGWIWANDEAAHAFKINRIASDDYQVTLYHEHGRIEMGPIWNEQQATLLEAWKQAPARAQADAWLKQAMAEATQVVPLEPVGATGLYQVMIEWRRADDDPDLWVPVGAWAANESEIAFVALPKFAPVETEYALAAIEAPLEAFEYYYAGANNYTVMRGKVDPVQASSATEAARQAIYARQFDTFRTE